MIDAGRVGFLLFVAMLLGLALVSFRTAHMRAVYEMTEMVEQEQEIRQEIWQQRLALSMAMERPQWLRGRVELLGLDLCPVGGEKPDDLRVAQCE